MGSEPRAPLEGDPDQHRPLRGHLAPGVGQRGRHGETYLQMQASLPHCPPLRPAGGAVSAPGSGRGRGNPRLPVGPLARSLSDFEEVPRNLLQPRGCDFGARDCSREQRWAGDVGTAGNVWNLNAGAEGLAPASVGTRGRPAAQASRGGSGGHWVKPQRALCSHPASKRAVWPRDGPPRASGRCRARAGAGVSPSCECPSGWGGEDGHPAGPLRGSRLGRRLAFRSGGSLLFPGPRQF